MATNRTRAGGSLREQAFTRSPLGQRTVNDPYSNSSPTLSEDDHATTEYDTSSLVDWLSSSLGYNHTLSPTQESGNASGGNTPLSDLLLNATSASSQTSLHDPASTQDADPNSPLGGTSIEALGGLPVNLDPLPVDRDKGVGIPEGSVFLPDVGYVQPPNLTGLDLLPRPHYQDHNNDYIWESLAPQVNLDNISRSAAIHLLNNSTADLWGNDSNQSLTNFSNARENVTVPFIPEGYLSGYSTEHVILTSIFVTLLMIIIIVGNGLVVLAIAIDRNLKAVQNWFIASLAISDLLVGLLIMPFSLANEVMGYWYFGNILCELWLATDVLLCTASIMNLCLISLDRFWSITRAISYVKQRTKKRAILMIALVWILSMIICFPPLVGWKRPQPMKFGKPLCVLSEDTGYVVYSTLGSFYIPLVVMVVVYFKIYLAARSRARRGLKKAAKQQQKLQQPPPVTDNGKSISTTTNTTTSFSTPTRDKTVKANNLLVDKEFSSFDENCEEESKPEEGEEHCPSPMCEKDIDKDNTLHHHNLLTVPSQNVHHVHPLDEKKKLLSDDTDSACESPIKCPAKKLSAKHIHFSEDTDSTSDSPSGRSSRAKFNGYRHHGPRSRSSTEENMKPLLEDSQLESDSQKESEKFLVQNNNLDMGDNEGDKECGEKVSPGADADDPEPGEELSSGQDVDQLNNDSVSSGNNKKPIVLTPAAFSRLNIQMRKNKLESREKHKRLPDDPEKQKRRIARAKERRAFIVLGIIMATFILCWLPFFSTYLISSLTGAQVPGLVFAVFFWAGYCNSALNPVTYTIFNRDFRQAFSKILFGRRSWS